MHHAIASRLSFQNPIGRWWTAFAAILALAAALRFYHIGQLEMWVDEDYSVVAATAPQGVLRCCMDDNNPPLYFLLLKGWIGVFGTSEAGVRSLSAVLGVAQLGLMGLLLARLGLGRRVALWAMLLGALAPLHHYYSQEARGYTLDYLMLTVLLWSLARAVAAGLRRDWAVHGLCLLAALYTHNLFVFFIPALVLGAWALGLGRIIRPYSFNHESAIVPTGLGESLPTDPALKGGAESDRPSGTGFFGDHPARPLERIEHECASKSRLRLRLRITSTKMHTSTKTALGWRWMGATYLGAGVLYLPWLWLTLGVVGNGSLAWIAGAWDPRVWPLLILRTLEVLWPGGRVPAILRITPSGAVTHLVALGMLGALLAAAWWPRRGGARAGEWRPVLFLTAAVFAPLLAMLGYSLVLHPIYVVGRYDTLIYPAFLGLAGLGAERMREALARRARPLLGLLLIVAPLVGLSLKEMGPRLAARPNESIYHPQAARARVLKDFLKPGDQVVCLGLEGSKVIYETMRAGVKTPIKTFPLETLRHLGYFSPGEVLRHPERLARDAREILDGFAPRAREGRRLWVMMDPWSFREAAPGGEAEQYTEIAVVLLEAIGAHGLVPWDPPEIQRRTFKLGIQVYMAR